MKSIGISIEREKALKEKDRQFCFGKDRKKLDRDTKKPDALEERELFDLFLKRGTKCNHSFENTHARQRG